MKETIMERSIHTRICLLALSSAVIIMCACLSGCDADKAKVTKATLATPAEIKRTLDSGLKVNGSVLRYMETEYLGASSMTSLRSRIQIDIVNTTPYTIKLGQDLVLLEANTAGDVFDGVYYARGHVMPRIRDQVFRSPPEEWRNYGISTAEHLLNDGSFHRSLPGSIDCFTKSPPEPLTFDPIQSGATSTLKIELKHGAWLKDDMLASLRIALPELSITTTEGEKQFRLIAYLARPEDLKMPWIVARTELVPLEVDGLAKILTTPEANLVQRVLAANWLSRLDANAGGQVLKNLANSQKEGVLLGCALVLMTQNRTPGLEDHARMLAQDVSVPKSIRMYALNYLGAVNHEASLDLLIDLGDPEKQKEGEIILGAIRGLGAMKHQRATDTLLQWLQKPESRWNKPIIQALLPSPEGLSGLQSLAGKGNAKILEELAVSGKSENFPFFVELMHSNAEKINKDYIRKGLRNSDREKAIPILLEVLAKEPAMEPDRWEGTYGSAADDLSEIGELLPVVSVETITSLAHQGNLRALQVLVRIPQEVGCEYFLELARTGHDSAQRIGFQGVAKKCATQGLPLLLESTKSKDEAIQKIAIEGLGAVNDSKAVLQLVDLLNGSKAKEAAKSLARSGPGDHADAVMSKLLICKGEDSDIFYHLVDCLLKHKWSDYGVSIKVAERLEEELNRIESTKTSHNQDYELMRLLRHISGNSIGPTDYADFGKKKGRVWLAEWKEWYQKQTDRKK
jgi:hypothetical protein